MNTPSAIAVIALALGTPGAARGDEARWAQAASAGSKSALDEDARRRLAAGLAKEVAAALQELDEAPDVEERSRIAGRLESLCARLEAELARQPAEARLHLALGDALNALGEEREDEALARWKKARELDPTLPDPWNNIGGHYAHRGPIEEGLPCFEKAVELAPDEPIYIDNLATAIFLFRAYARERYGIDEQAVFDKALALYRRALALDPTYERAWELAITYSGIEPYRAAAAIADWEQALTLARSPAQAQRVHVHLARWKARAGRLEEARRHLDAVTEPELQELRRRALRSLEPKP
ncbi:MAG: hypothetical protein HY554_08595 [Elusimicrobia bacterium]|nr:hypothetical protein [Elusimicrobiota bacterium]